MRQEEWEGGEGRGEERRGEERRGEERRGEERRGDQSLRTSLMYVLLLRERSRKDD